MEDGTRSGVLSVLAAGKAPLYVLDYGVFIAIGIAVEIRVGVYHDVD